MSRPFRSTAEHEPAHLARIPPLSPRTLIPLSEVTTALVTFNRDYPRPGIGALSVSEPFFVIRDFQKGNFPTARAAGVYLIFDHDENLLYVGLARGLGRRLGAHFGWNADRSGGMIKNPIFKDAWSVRTIALPPGHRFEAAAVEAYLIAQLAPPVNTLGIRDRAL